MYDRVMHTNTNTTDTYDDLITLARRANQSGDWRNALRIAQCANRIKAAS